MTFKVKTGLKVNSTDVINSNGYWIGSTITNDKTTASSSNGASTIVARDASGDFTARNITATLFAGSGASLTNIPNSATTASSSNGASTIVARDASGAFAAGAITATSVSAATLTGVAAIATVSNTATLTNDESTNATNYLTFVNATTGNQALRTDSGVTYNPSTNTLTAGVFSGSGASLTSIPNSATTASASNGASTIVARDASGSFTTNGITATSVSAPTLTGVAAVATVANTSTLTADNTTNATNYVPFINAATGNQALRTSLGFSFNPSTNTLTTSVVSAPTLTGVAAVATVSNTSTLTADNTTNATNYLTFVNAATGNQALRTDIGLSFNPSTNTLTTSVVSAPTLTGVAAVATVANTVTLTSDESTAASRYILFSASTTGDVSPRTDSGITYNPSTNTLTAGVFSGSGASLTNIPNSATTASASNGASTIVARDGAGAFAAGAITGTTITATTFSGSGASLTSIPNSATTASSSNGASTIVARDGAGAFAAGAITATSIAANGAGLTAINASNITLGTLSNSVTTASAANGASTIVARAANGHFGTASITVDSNLNVGGNAVITGNLTVNGTQTIINTNIIELADNQVVLNSDHSGAPTQDAGIIVNRGSSTNTDIKWNESTDRWTFTNNGTTYYNIPNSTEYDLYSVSAGTAASGANLTITAATNGTTSNVNFVGSGTVTVTRTNASTITISGAGSLESETTGITNTSASIVDSFSTTTYRTAEYTYHVKTTTGTAYYATGKILIVHDGTSTYQTQYGMLSTNVNDDLATFTSNISTGSVRLLAQGTNANVTVKLVGTNYSTV